MRDTRMLHPNLQAIIPRFLAECRRQGLKVRITDCFRTVEEQNALYAKGRTASGSIVTGCKGTDYSSPHQWGIAFDFCRNDKSAYDDSDGFFRKVGKIGETMGLQWGGDWKTPDQPHLQLAEFFDARETTAYIKSRYQNPDAFKAIWGVSSVLGNWGNLSDSALTAMLEKVPQVPQNTTIKYQDQTLRSGTKGDNVRAIQSRLTALGYPCTADGICGNKTISAITAYQRDHKLIPDGLCGKNTWTSLFGWR